jgi:hypothetical protein
MRSNPGALWLLQFDIAFFTSAGLKSFIGRLGGHGELRNSSMSSSLSLLLEVD